MKADESRSETDKRYDDMFTDLDNENRALIAKINELRESSKLRNQSSHKPERRMDDLAKLGRASCRERVSLTV